MKEQISCECRSIEIDTPIEIPGLIPAMDLIDETLQEEWEQWKTSQSLKN